jgi:hypothetical protein
MHEGNTNDSQQKLNTLGEVKVRGSEKNPASVLSSQSDYIVVEHVEREALPRASVEVRQQEIVPPIEEIPSMVQLDSPQLRKSVLLTLGPEGKVDSGRRKNSSYPKRTSSELVVLAGDGA